MRSSRSFQRRCVAGTQLSYDRSIRVTAPDGPNAWVEIPVLSGESMIEVWFYAPLVARNMSDDLCGARNDNTLFGCLPLDLPLEVETAYMNVFSP